ncbi:MAG: hypothetical protein JWQ37_1895 [Blastococcus sp.]|nr:hypothetical protein [Blastococcus sp.]
MLGEGAGVDQRQERAGHPHQRPAGGRRPQPGPDHRDAEAVGGLRVLPHRTQVQSRPGPVQQHVQADRYQGGEVDQRVLGTERPADQRDVAEQRDLQPRQGLHQRLSGGLHDGHPEQQSRQPRCGEEQRQADDSCTAGWSPGCARAPAANRSDRGGGRPGCAGHPAGDCRSPRPPPGCRRGACPRGRRRRRRRAIGWCAGRPGPPVDRDAARVHRTHAGQRLGQFHLTVACDPRHRMNGTSSGRPKRPLRFTSALRRVRKHTRDRSPIDIRLRVVPVPPVAP